jgi:hypothetical protein
MHNNGSKTGAILACELKIYIPVATPVTDDNADQGPLRLQLAGSIVAPGMIVGDAVNRLRLVEDPDMVERAFTWSGTLQR